MVEANWAFSIIQFVSSTIGVFFFFVISVLSIFCTLNALLLLSNEYRIVFIRSSRAAGIIIGVFGLLLPFRGLPSVATLSSLYWVAILFDAIPYFKLLQTVALTVFSWSFWIYYLNKNGDDMFFMLSIGDFFIFVIIPTIFGIVLQAKGNEELDVVRRSENHGRREGYKIPLGAILAKCASLFRNVFPPEN